MLMVIFCILHYLLLRQFWLPDLGFTCRYSFFFLKYRSRNGFITPDVGY